MAQHSAGVSRSRPQLLFRHQKQNIRAQEALYLKQLLEDFGIQQKHPIAIGEDIQTCIMLCQNPVMHKRSKHIETKFQFIRDKTGDGTISIHYVPTDKMAGNIFTKSLPLLYPTARKFFSQLQFTIRFTRNLETTTRNTLFHVQIFLVSNFIENVMRESRDRNDTNSNTVLSV